MKEECSEATLFHTTEKDALRVNYRKPDTIIRCGLWWFNDHESDAYTGQHNPYQNWYLSLVLWRLLC